LSTFWKDPLTKKLMRASSFGVPVVPDVAAVPVVRRDGTDGWDAYAPFYDWENVRTIGRRDVAFWRGLAAREGAPVLELGCGTGRVLVPMARTGLPVTGIDRSAPMLEYARRRARRLPAGARPGIVRGDIRALPFPRAAFGLVVAPYGMLQSLLHDRDLMAALGEASRVLQRGGLLGIDLVPDLARWDEYSKTMRLAGRGRAGSSVTLIESVRQDRARGLTVFDEMFVERRNGRARRHRFSLTFRTRPIREIARRLTDAGFRVDATLGDYQGGPWDPRAQVWLLLARRT
jgi:SAM-dependent methyltransferase